MTYSELIKNFAKIRKYISRFFIYGSKNRNEYASKSARSYGNERRRIKSRLGEYMSFRQNPDGKNVFFAVDSRRYKFVADVYDAVEMLPWIRIFTGSITKLTSTNSTLLETFNEDLKAMHFVYGSDKNAVQ